MSEQQLIEQINATMEMAIQIATVGFLLYFVARVIYIMIKLARKAYPVA